MSTRAFPLVLAFALLPDGAAAQVADTVVTTNVTEADRHLRDDRWVLEFSLPDIGIDGRGGGVLGFWNMVSPRTSLGADIGLSVRTNAGEFQEDSVTHRSEHTMVSLSFKPGIRRYFETRRSVAAFVELAVPLSVGGNAGSSYSVSSQWHAGFGVSGAIGLNWFITDALSLAGGLGASLSYSHLEAEYEDPDRISRSESVSFDLQTGELRLGIWF